MIQSGELVLLVSPKGKRYLRVMDPESTLHTNDGALPMADVARAGYGTTVANHMGKPYRIVRPTLYDLVKNVKRQTQIIYPKDIGYILVRLGIGPGVKVVEAGSGSGSLTVAMAWSVGPTGKVFTYERRPEFAKLCKRNLRWAGIDDDRVEHHDRDIAEGFEDHQADALILDVRTPWEYLEHVPKAVVPGAPVAFLLPTMNQVSDLLAGLAQGPFTDEEVVELMLRRYKTVPDRMRPEDRMVAHTAYLVFARVSQHAQPPAKLPATPMPGEPMAETEDTGADEPDQAEE